MNFRRFVNSKNMKDLYSWISLNGIIYQIPNDKTHETYAKEHFRKEFLELMQEGYFRITAVINTGKIYCENNFIVPTEKVRSKLITLLEDHNMKEIIYCNGKINHTLYSIDNQI